MATGCGTHSRALAGCLDCRRVDSAYRRRRDRMISAGTWKHRVPADTVFAHVGELRAQGMSLAAIARAANIAPRTLWSAMHTPRHWLQGSTGHAILGVTAQPSPPAGFVYSIGATRRIRALVAIGYSLSDIARALNKWVQPVLDLAWAKRPTVAEDTHQLVADLYERLSDTPGTSVRARNTAQKNGWVPPVAWDDNIDDPNAEPYEVGPHPDAVIDDVAIDCALTGAQVSLSPLEEHRAVHVGHERGMSVTRLTIRLGISKDKVRRLAGTPLPDGYELVA